MNLLKKNNNNIDRDSTPLEEQERIFIEIAEERSSGLRNLEKGINLDNLKCKTEGRNPKDFRNYQNLIELFKDLRDGNINPLKNIKRSN